MEAKISFPPKTYPYLAVYVGANNPYFDISKIKVKDIVVISLVKPTGAEDKQPHVQNLLGDSQPHFTEHEDFYRPLPANFEITLTN